MRFFFDACGFVYAAAIVYVVYKIIDLTVKIRKDEQDEHAGVQMHDLYED